MYYILKVYICSYTFIMYKGIIITLSLLYTFTVNKQLVIPLYIIKVYNEFHNNIWEKVIIYSTDMYI